MSYRHPLSLLAPGGGLCRRPPAIGRDWARVCAEMRRPCPPAVMRLRTTEMRTAPFDASATRPHNPLMSPQPRKILLGVTGGIAA
jgi:hypothetical protein